MAGISLGSNISSLVAQRWLSDASFGLARTYERLSSGQRINRASDDAAGLAVSSKLTASSRVYNQAIRNLSDGISAANIAEGALGSLKAISERQLELAHQAANGTYSLAQRQALNLEANSLTREFNRLIAGIGFNGLNLLDPGLGNIVLQAGYGISATLNMNVTDELRRSVGDGTFSSFTTINLGGTPYSLLSGDFNGDGKLDIATAGDYSGFIDVAFGTGNGTFSGGVNVYSGSMTPRSLATGDFNGDGKLDLVAGGYLNPYTLVFINNGNGTFQSARTVSMPGESVLPYYNSITVGDFNGDGNQDFVAADENNYTLYLALGNGNGTFQSARSMSTGSNYNYTVASGDLNGDGKLDIVTNNNSKSLVYFGLGNGTFQTALTLTQAAGGAGAIEVADFNLDGSLDIISSAGTKTYVFMNSGNGSFQPARTISTSGTANSISIADFDGDGIPDFVQNGSAYLGNGDGTFRQSATLVTGNSIVAGDFNGDGRYDIMSNLNYEYGKIQFFRGLGSYSTSSPYLNLNTQQDALDAMDTIESTLERIRKQLGSIGATTSRFSSALSTLYASEQNYLAAASRIMDADIAAEAATLTRQQILQQVAQAVLAQANLRPELALSLLRTAPGP